tara:strand:+ start:49 stop:513 length:465 start_codon:yes stop_codon:yes gene_type:complete
MFVLVIDVGNKDIINNGILSYIGIMDVLLDIKDQMLLLNVISGLGLIDGNGNLLVLLDGRDQMLPVIVINGLGLTDGNGNQLVLLDGRDQIFGVNVINGLGHTKKYQIIDGNVLLDIKDLILLLNVINGGSNGIHNLFGTFVAGQVGDGLIDGN